MEQEGKNMQQKAGYMAHDGTKCNWERIFLLALNCIGTLCLLYFAIRYLWHDMTVPNPEAMLPMEDWEAAGYALTLGFLPLLIVNVGGYILMRQEHRKRFVRVLFLLPSILCAGIVAHCWIPEIFSAITDPYVPVESKVEVLTQATDGTREHVILFDDGGLGISENHFEPDGAKEYIADVSCFSASVINHQVVNTLESAQIQDSTGNIVQADKTMTALLQALADHMDHAILEVKVFEDKGEYFAAVRTNVNLVSPCELYCYHADIGEIELLYTWDDTDVIAIALPE